MLEKKERRCFLEAAAKSTVLEELRNSKQVRKIPTVQVTGGLCHLPISARERQSLDLLCNVLSLA